MNQRCKQCGTEMAGTAVACHQCGALNTIGIPCDLHPDRNAVGACVVCARPMCVECLGDSNGVALCSDQHRTLFTSSRMLAVVSSEHEADAVVVNLKANGIAVAVFPVKANVGYYWLEGSDECRLFVNTNQFDQATLVLETLHLMEE